MVTRILRAGAVPEFWRVDLVIRDGIGEALVGAVDVELELGLDHGDGLGDLGVFRHEDDVVALGRDGATLLAADDGVGDQCVELLGVAGQELGKRQLVEDGIVALGRRHRGGGLE